MNFILFEKQRGVGVFRNTDRNPIFHLQLKSSFSAIFLVLTTMFWNEMTRTSARQLEFTLSLHGLGRNRSFRIRLDFVKQSQSAFTFYFG